MDTEETILDLRDKLARVTADNERLWTELDNTMHAYRVANGLMYDYRRRVEALMRLLSPPVVEEHAGDMMQMETEVEHATN